jgi:hypothetical protein
MPMIEKLKKKKLYMKKNDKFSFKNHFMRLEENVNFQKLLEEEFKNGFRGLLSHKKYDVNMFDTHVKLCIKERCQTNSQAYDD